MKSSRLAPRTIPGPLDRHETDLHIWPDENLVSVTRRFFEEVYEHVTRDFETVRRIALAAHELLENAVKYGDGNPARLQVSWSRSDEGGNLCVRVTNSATPENQTALRAWFAEKDATDDAFAHYQALMRRSAKASSSGLGLARICAEGDLALTLEVEGDRVSLCARGETGERV